MLPLIDGDIIRYRIGFACQYTLYWNDQVSEAIKGKRNWQEHLKENPDQVDLQEYSMDVVSPVDHCLHSVKVLIQKILARCESDRCVIYLTGKGNFRDQVAKTKKYKGNRVARKPDLYNDITEYLVSMWNATIVDGIEADDALSIYQNAFPGTCIASTDKDLLQVPGVHYNFVKDEFIHVPAIDGLRFLYQQILSGDATDNIQGIPGIGEMKAKKALISCKTELDMYKVVKSMYKEYFKDDWEEHLTETAQLVYLLKHPEDRFEPPKENEGES